VFFLTGLLHLSLLKESLVCAETSVSIRKLRSQLLWKKIHLQSKFWKVVLVIPQFWLRISLPYLLGFPWLNVCHSEWSVPPPLNLVILLPIYISDKSSCIECIFASPSSLFIFEVADISISMIDSVDFSKEVNVGRSNNQIVHWRHG
jgi:hypothetical protein